MTGFSLFGRYKVGLAEVELSFDEHIVAYWSDTQVQAYEATEKLITMPDPPTAVLVCSEMITKAVLRCIKDYESLFHVRLVLSALMIC
ncbi:MAG: hypothetical protein E4H40_03660 [Candidatus Brocadiia bacterium]|nr:MAG: hypothetical protein E4H40_03660 [Candidatus Brocadiia bacterium]